MKKILTLFAVVLLFQSFQCEDDTAPTDQSFDLVTLQQERQLILNYIATFSCNDASSCNSIAFGSKACGGPKEYLVYPSTVDLEYLTEKVNNYNAMENSYNVKYNVVSDCMAVMPPQNIGCVDGVCTVLP
ncbi:hypothetical protein [Flavobacterium sp.]|jgi:hypothetical protein|uniref:hypothetical protein n=1 Tax=Flavobacterium sp. TaxID=239 RepID=UPI0037C0AEBD